MSNENTKVSVTFTVEPHVKNAIEKLADKEERTLSAQVSYLFKTMVLPQLNIPQPDGQPATPMAGATS